MSSLMKIMTIMIKIFTKSDNNNYVNLFLQTMSGAQISTDNMWSNLQLNKYWQRMKEIYQPFFIVCFQNVI